MVDPVSLGVMAGVGMAGTVAGGIIGGLGAQESGQAAAAASTYKAGVALLNKQINDKNAEFALEGGSIKAMEEGLRSGQAIGQTKVAQSASGLDVNTGTAVTVRENQTTASQFDQNVIEWDAEKTAYGYETKSTMDVAESNLDIMAAGQQRTAGDIGELTSFINAGSSVASKWSQGKQTGLFQTT